MKFNLTSVFTILLFIFSGTLQAQIITTVSGNGTRGYNGDNIPAISAELYSPNDVTPDSAGNLYIADRLNYRIRRVDAKTGNITTVAGNGVQGYSNDNIAATSAMLFFPTSVVVNGKGDIFFAEADTSNRIRKVDATTGIITTVAGNGTAGYNGDGMRATSAELFSPDGLVMDNSGNIFIGDFVNQRVRRVDAVSGIITTVAGNGTQGYNGDSIPATTAELYQPGALALDKQGNLYIAELGGYRVRKVDAVTGMISTVAGTGVYEYNGDSMLATVTNLREPSGVAVDSGGNLYVSEEGNGYIRKIDALTGIMTIIAGSLTGYHIGDGYPATEAELSAPEGISIDNNGFMYVADNGNNRIRRFPVLSSDFYVVLTPTKSNCNASGSVTTSVYGGVPPYTYSWSTGDSIANLYYLSPGVYYVTITDSNGRQTSGYSVVQGACNTIVNGRVFNDVNADCVFDSTDLPCFGQVVKVTTGNGHNYYGNTGANGFYSIDVPDSGTMYISITSDLSANCARVENCSKAIDTIFVANTGDSVNNINFVLNFTGFDLTLLSAWTSASPGFTKQYSVMPYNLTTVPVAGMVTVIFNYDPNLIYQSSQSPLPVADTINHTLTWTVSGSTIPVGTWDWNNERFVSNFYVPSTLSTNYQLQSSFTALPYTGDCDTANNTLSFSEAVTGSHDPNAKAVSPAGELNPADSVLTYTIYFQNTGTAATNFVTVVDSLSSNLEPASVINLAGSANYTSFNISGTGILTWTFNPLQLPAKSLDSTVSQGFIMFSVHTKPGLQSGSSISNSAIVYFDYNTPIQTNTVTNTVAAVTGATSSVKTGSVNISAFPNPFNEQTHIEVSSIEEKYDFELFDVTGRVQLSYPNLQASEFNLMRGNLPTGVYLYRVVVAGKPAGYGKLVVE